MDRINRILEHPIFKECVKRNEMAEAKRCFCHHDIEHSCAVARIAIRSFKGFSLWSSPVT